MPNLGPEKSRGELRKGSLLEAPELPSLRSEADELVTPEAQTLALRTPEAQSLAAEARKPRDGQT